MLHVNYKEKENKTKGNIKKLKHPTTWNKKCQMVIQLSLAVEWQFHQNQPKKLKEKKRELEKNFYWSVLDGILSDTTGRFGNAFQINFWPLFLELKAVNAASHSCTVVCGTFLSPVKGAQDPFEKSVRTHWTFSGTLEKSNFKGKVFAFVADFFCFWPPEPSLYRQEIWKSMLEGRLDEWKGIISNTFKKTNICC